MGIKEQIESYTPFNEQEKQDKKLLLEFLSDRTIFKRENKKAHFTASAWVVNSDRTKVIMAYHNIYDSWAWLGGHSYGDENLFNVAKREAAEESGVDDIVPLSGDIFSLEILTVSGHEKKGEYVPSHLHLNVTYIFEASENAVLKIKEDENSGVAWINLDDIENKSSEKWMKERIYSKLIKKMKRI